MFNFLKHLFHGLFTEKVSNYIFILPQQFVFLLDAITQCLMTYQKHFFFLLTFVFFSELLTGHYTEGLFSNYIISIEN